MKEEKIDIIATKVDTNSNRLDNLTNKVDLLTTRVDDNSKKIDILTTRVDDNSKKLDEHTRILNEHTKDLQSIKRTLTIIEDAVTNKIPALFDAHQANQEKHEEFDNRITNVENISSTNSLKISILEDSSKMHSIKLAKLSSKI